MGDELCRGGSEQWRGGNTQGKVGSRGERGGGGGGDSHPRFAALHTVHLIDATGKGGNALGGRALLALQLLQEERPP